MALNPHGQWIANKLKEALGPDGHLADGAVKDAQQQVQALVGADGPLKIMFFFQLPEAETDFGEYITIQGAKPKLFFTTGERERVRGRCFYFVRMNNAKALDIKSIETDMTYGEVPPNILESFQVTLSQVFTPAIATQEWGKSTEEERTEFQTQLEKFNHTLNDAAMSLQGGIELRKPDKLGEVENKQAAYMRAAIDESILSHCEQVVQEWCSQTEVLLAESEENRRESDDAGPDTELIFWRNRMAKFNSVAEQLKSKESKFVLGVVSFARCNMHMPAACILYTCLRFQVTTAKSKVFKTWKQIDNQITDALNEAKDNVKYLATLEKYTEPLFNGTPEHIIEALPGGTDLCSFSN